MSKNKHGNRENPSTDEGNQPLETSDVPPATSVNRTLTFHSQHPRTGEADRVSYVIPGVSGNLVIFKSLFKDGVAPTTLTLDIDLAEPTIKVDKAAEKAAKDIERAKKAQEKIDLAAVKAKDRAEKAQKTLAEATRKLEEAKAKLEGEKSNDQTATDETPSTNE